MYVLLLVIVAVVSMMMMMLLESVTLTHLSWFIDVAATWVGRYFGMT